MNELSGGEFDEVLPTRRFINCSANHSLNRSSRTGIVHRGDSISNSSLDLLHFWEAFFQVSVAIQRLSEKLFESNLQMVWIPSPEKIKRNEYNVDLCF